MPNKTDTQELINKIAKNAGSVKPMRNPIKSSVIWVGISIIYLFVMFFVLGIRFDFADKIKEILFITEILIAGTGAIFASVAAIFLSYPDEYQKPQIKWWAVFFNFALLAILLFYLHDQNTNIQKVNATTSTYACALDMAVFAVFPVVVMLFSLRRARTTRAGWYIGCMCLAAVNISYVALRFIEPNDLALHLLFWHYIPMLQTVLIGIILGRLFCRW